MRNQAAPEPTFKEQQQLLPSQVTKVITVTLHPAFDRTVELDGLEPERVNRVLHERLDPGGKGVNVSRVLTAFGVSNTALVLAGRSNLPIYRHLLQKEQVNGVYLPIEGAIRENTTFVLPDHRILKVDKAGAQAGASVIPAVEYALGEQLIDREHTVVVFSGSLPPGLTGDLLVGLISGLTQVRVAVDTASLTLQQLLQCKPWLIKPNIHELRALTDRPLKERREIVAAARGLVKAGIENVLVSLGEDGLLLIDSEQAVQAVPPAVEVRSTVGAGDSALAGFLFAKSKPLPNEQAGGVAAAFGTAAVMTEGTNAPRKEDVSALLKKVAVQKMLF